MIKCFLSHSSKDKENYVRVVAAKLRKEVKIFDEETFEKGMMPIEEIARSLDETALFVIFLSNASLDSDWVKRELYLAGEKLVANQIERIYPIFIEPDLTHKDPRIPKWMVDSLNIQFVRSPALAARLINSRLVEISWKFHPRLKERQQIFVGRNDLIKAIEERLDDFSAQPPLSLIISGLSSIGRKSLIRAACRKANLIRDSYSFPIVSLSAQDSVEDFILKISDLGFGQSLNINASLSGSLDQKVETAKLIAAEIVESRERLLIEDRGVLVQENGEIVDWFAKVNEYIRDHEHLTFCIASQFRVNGSINRINPDFFSLSLREMEAAERNGLFKRYCEFHELAIPREEANFFTDILTGYPEQALFAVDLIIEKGLREARQNSHIIQQYGSDKSKVVLDGLRNNEELLSFIYLLSKFEFISYEVLFDIVDEKKYAPMVGELLAHSVLERLGSAGDYLRVTEVIRDYISRSRFGTPLEFKSAIERHIKSFVERYTDEQADISDYLFSAQEILRAGGELPNEIIIPSVFLKSIKKLYDEDRNYSEALVLIERVLKRSASLHANTINHIRFIQCQCYARLRDSKFFGTVVHISEPSRSFLHGFFYRIAGEYEKAAESLNSALSKARGQKRDPRVLGELILVYLQGEEYDLAFELAKENYYARSNNLLNANNYFTCLIRKDRSEENRKELESIIEKLSIDQSARAKEITGSARARFSAFYDGDSESPRNY